MHFSIVKYHFFRYQDFRLLLNLALTGVRKWFCGIWLVIYSFCCKYIWSIFGNGGLDINELNQRNTENLRGTLICLFYVESFLVWKSVLIKLYLVYYHSRGLVSNFCWNFTKISQPQSLWDFHCKHEARCSATCSQNLITKKLVNQMISSHMFKIFLLTMFGRVTIILLESSLWFETAISLKSLCRREETVGKLTYQHIFKPQKEPHICFFFGKKCIPQLLFWCDTLTIEWTFHGLKHAIVSLNFS